MDCTHWKTGTGTWSTISHSSCQVFITEMTLLMFTNNISDPIYNSESEFQTLPIQVIFEIPSIGIAAAEAEDNKALLLTSTILYSIAATILFVAICIILKWMDIPEYLFGDLEDEGYLPCIFGCGPCLLASLLLSMEVVSAVCSGLLYKQ